MFSKKSEEFSVDEIVSAMQQGEKQYRMFKDGHEKAKALKAMHDKFDEIQRSVASGEALKASLHQDIEDARVSVKAEEQRAKDIVREAEEKAMGLINKAQADILLASQKSEEDLEDAARSLAAVKEEILEAEVERDTIKAEIRDLTELKEKTRQQLLSGTA